MAYETLAALTRACGRRRGAPAVCGRDAAVLAGGAADAEVMLIGDRSRVRAADGLEEARTLVDLRCLSAGLRARCNAGRAAGGGDATCWGGVLFQDCGGPGVGAPEPTPRGRVAALFKDSRNRLSNDSLFLEDGSKSGSLRWSRRIE